MTDNVKEVRPSAWNGWRIARWTVAAVLLLTPLAMMQVSEDWNWTIGDFLFAAIMIGGVSLLYEWAEKANGSRAYRTGAAVALAGAFLTVWTTLVRDDGTGIGYFMVVLAAAASGYAARFQPAGMARGLIGVAVMQFLLGLAIATAPSTAHAAFGPLKVMLFGLFFTALWLTSAAFFRSAARSEAASER